MTTKADFRNLLRRTLEDTSLAAPLWTDATLDDAIADALVRYGAMVPLETRSSVAVPLDAVQISVAGLESGSWIVAVRDPAGRLIEPIGRDDAIPAQGWRWWNGAIELNRPAIAGTWAIDWRSPRTLPPLETDAMPIRSGDDPAVASLAAASVFRRFAVEEAKRGSRGSEAFLSLAMQFDREGERLVWNRGRFLRGSFARRS